MEEPARVSLRIAPPPGRSGASPPRPARAVWRPGAAIALGLALLGVGGMLGPDVAGAVGEDPGAEVAEALRSLGPPGVLWGRLAVEEESPLGAWTPLGAVEVTVYPATPALVTELERIRQSARASGAEYESAVARVQAALAIHQARVDGKAPDGMSPDGALPAEPPVSRAPRPAATKGGVAPGSRPRPGGPTARAGVAPPVSAEEPLPHPWRQKTDPAGLFAFDTLPSGDWLVVAVQISPYRGEKLRAAPKAKAPARGMTFLPRAAGPAKEAELWVVRVRVGAGERVGLELTDRGRWLAGPVR